MAQLNPEKNEIDVHFQYPIEHDPLLTELRRLASIKLDANASELENAKNIIGYAHGLFAHDGNNTPSLADPLTILKEAQAGQSFRCVEYSTLAAGLLWANGIPARTLGLKTSDVETREYGAGHVVIEFWSKDFNKWIMSDVQAGLIAEHDNIPLTTYELKQNLDNEKPVEYISVTGSRFVPGAPYDEEPSYSNWIHPYLYFIDTPASLTLGNEDKSKRQIVMLIPSGVKPPEMFQGMFKMNALYIDKPQAFYAAPNTG
jgi:hypothetical protein